MRAIQFWEEQAAKTNDGITVDFEKLFKISETKTIEEPMDILQSSILTFQGGYKPETYEELRDGMLKEFRPEGRTFVYRAIASMDTFPENEALKLLRHVPSIRGPLKLEEEWMQKELNEGNRHEKPQFQFIMFAYYLMWKNNLWTDGTRAVGTSAVAGAAAGGWLNLKLAADAVGPLAGLYAKFQTTWASLLAYFTNYSIIGAKISAKLALLFGAPWIWVGLVGAAAVGGGLWYVSQRERLELSKVVGADRKAAPALVESKEWLSDERRILYDHIADLIAIEYDLLSKMYEESRTTSSKWALIGNQAPDNKMPGIELDNTTILNAATGPLGSTWRKVDKKDVKGEEITGDDARPVQLALKYKTNFERPLLQTMKVKTKIDDKQMEFSLYDTLLKKNAYVQTQDGSFFQAFATMGHETLEELVKEPQVGDYINVANQNPPEFYRYGMPCDQPNTGTQLWEKIRGIKKFSWKNASEENYSVLLNGIKVNEENIAALVYESVRVTYCSLPLELKSILDVAGAAPLAARAKIDRDTRPAGYEARGQRLLKKAGHEIREMLTGHGATDLKRRATIEDAAREGALKEQLARRAGAGGEELF